MSLAISGLPRALEPAPPKSPGDRLFRLAGMLAHRLRDRDSFPYT